MVIPLIRRSERIRNRQRAASSSMLCRTKREGAGTIMFSSHDKKNKKIRRLNRVTSSISMLPDDLVIEILSRLPPKPFFRCRTICKSWLSLSSDALGLNKHLRPTLGGIFYNNTCFGVGFVNLCRGADRVEVDRTVHVLSISYDILRIIDCCNGLLLIEALNKNTLTVHNLYVYNPATRTLFNVWSFTPPYGHDWFYQTFSLAFDPQVYSQFHIIHFSGWSDDEQIFSFIDIFSFERGKCTSQKQLACDMIKSHSKGTFIEGRVYRITSHGKILSINANECSYEVMNAPEIEIRPFDKIEQSQGLLHYLSLCDKKGLLFIWVLKSHIRQEWTLKHQLSLNKIYSVLKPHCDVSRICYRILMRGHFVFHPEKDILFMPVGCDDLMSLDLSTGKRKELLNIGEEIDLGPWVYMPCYLV